VITNLGDAPRYSNAYSQRALAMHATQPSTVSQ